MSVALLTQLCLPVRKKIKNSSNLLWINADPIQSIHNAAACVFITSRWCKCSVCCLCPCNFPQPEGTGMCGIFDHCKSSSPWPRARSSTGRRVFVPWEWWMIYGVNCSISIYFSHWCKSVSQPPPMGSLRVSPGRSLCHCGNTATQIRLFSLSEVEHERASQSGCFSVATWSPCWIAVHEGHNTPLAR